jgi:hypothetical protein
MRTAALTLALLGIVPAALAAVPGEDDPRTAVRVPSLPFEDDRPSPGPGRGAWYAYVPEQDETVHLSAAARGRGTTLSVWVQEGDVLVPLQRAVGTAAGAPALLRTRLTAGRTYLVHVGTAQQGRRLSGSRLVLRLERAARGLSSVDARVTDVAVDWDGTVTVSGTVQCDECGRADVYLQVTQAVGPSVANGDGHVGTACSSTPTPWRTTLRSCTWIGFGAGRMTVSAVVWAYDGHGSATQEVAPAWFSAGPAP